MNLTFPVITVAALVDSINPCAVSVLLLTIGFLTSLKKSSRQIFLFAGLYILGIYFTYLLIGLGFLRALTFFGIPKILSKFGALILIVTSIINLIGHFYPKFPIKLVIPSFTKPKIASLIYASSFPSFFLMGVLVGVFEFPCTGGPYLLILSLLHDNSKFVNGLLYLIYYNLIFVSPLVLILYLSTNSVLAEKVQLFRKKHSSTSDLAAAIITLTLGISIFIFASL